MKTAASDPITAAVASVTALLASIERSSSPAATVAFRAAIRRNGQNLQVVAGSKALTAVLVRIRAAAADPAHAEERERIVREAWFGILGSQDTTA